LFEEGIIITEENYDVRVLENLIDNIRSALNELVCYNDKVEYKDNILYISQVLDKLIAEHARITSPYVKRKKISQC
jgi:hypothetical protein